MTDSPNDVVDPADVTPDLPVDPVDPNAPDLNTIPDADGLPHVAPGVTL